MGVAELLVVVPVALVFTAIPVATLAGVVLTYRKLKTIEKKLGG